jgi:hypothetical protein
MASEIFSMMAAFSCASKIPSVSLMDEGHGLVASSVRPAARPSG